MSIIQQVIAVYFSATGTTKKVVTTIAKKLASELGANYSEYDFTPLSAREVAFTALEDSVVVFGTPVYAGRVPNVLLKYLATVVGNGALAVPIVSYGNRNYDDALMELRDILSDSGFLPVSAAAFASQHSFSEILAKGRPDKKDLDDAERFAVSVAKKIKQGDSVDVIEVKGTPKPYSGYYRPKGSEGEFIDIRKVKPVTRDNCIDCKICAEVCPMGSINYDNVNTVDGICIKCCACIKKCPVNAKEFIDENFLFHKHDLEEKFFERKTPDLFV